MSKNIIIYGTSRSGKTNLGQYLAKKLNYNLVCGDNFVSAFEKAYPDLGISHNDRTGESVNNLKNFLWCYIDCINKKDKKEKGLNYVIESAYFDIEDVVKQIDKFCVIILLGNYNSYHEILCSLKKYDKPFDWTFTLTEKDKEDYSKLLFENNKNLKNYCDKNNIKYYPTNINRKSVFAKIFKSLNLTE